MQHLIPFSYFDILGKSQKAYSRYLDPVCKQWGLTRNELDVILFLFNNPQFDRASDIVAHRGIAKSHVSMSVAALEERAVLKKYNSETDRRAVHLKLTKYGQEIAATGRVAQQDFFRVLFSDISEAELGFLAEITEKVHKRLDAID